MTQTPHIDLDALSAYLDDALPDAERRDIAAHLTDCARCAQELAELRATVSLLRGLPQYQPRRSFRLGAEHTRPPSGRPVRLLPVIRPLAIAAVVLFAVVTGLAYFQDDPSSDLGQSVEPQLGAPADDDAIRQGTTRTPQTSLMIEAPTGAADADLEQGASAGDQEAAAPQAAIEESQVLAESEDAAPTGTAAAGLGNQADAVADGAGAGASLQAPEPGAGQRRAPDERIDSWSLASVGLGLVAAVLLVAWAALARLGNRRGR